MERCAVQGHVNVDAAVGLDETDVFDVALAKLDDLGVACDQAGEANGYVLARKLLLFQGEHQKIDEIVLGVEFEIIEKQQLIVTNNGEIERTTIDVDVNDGLIIATILVHHTIQENARLVGNRNIVP